MFVAPSSIWRFFTLILSSSFLLFADLSVFKERLSINHSFPGFWINTLLTHVSANRIFCNVILPWKWEWKLLELNKSSPWNCLNQVLISWTLLIPTVFKLGKLRQYCESARARQGFLFGSGRKRHFSEQHWSSLSE